MPLAKFPAHYLQFGHISMWYAQQDHSGDTRELSVLKWRKHTQGPSWTLQTKILPLLVFTRSLDTHEELKVFNLIQLTSVHTLKYYVDANLQEARSKKLRWCWTEAYWVGHVWAKEMIYCMYHLLKQCSCVYSRTQKNCWLTKDPGI